MTAEQKAASEKAARILELRGELMKSAVSMHAHAVKAEVMTLAPDVATALIDAHAEIERLKGAARVFIEAEKGMSEFLLNPQGSKLREVANRYSAALDALKEIAG